jgi:hypothetical protein
MGYLIKKKTDKLILIKFFLKARFLYLLVEKTREAKTLVRLSLFGFIKFLIIFRVKKDILEINQNKNYYKV